MTDKTYAVAGVSTQNGKTKIRFANDSFRIKILVKNGHTDVELIDLPEAMSKADAVSHLLKIGFGSDKPAVQDALKSAAKKYGSVVAETETKEAEAEPVAE